MSGKGMVHYFLLSYLTGFPRDFRPGMQGFIPFMMKPCDVP
ncbi:hypothetical protein GLUCOINTEAF2_0201454 [Komagataeibacter intermedius AF2]|uniref:Uncharacterized protein n=1 Tax=Komagataeibacter intermedius AF2 TaxID=1458464 RepID=A0A0N1FRN4_9PROT|nr:hypothetical protein GLUCOINTEAF2_0201454 [Komagataeibacter intermedius AF2]